MPTSDSIKLIECPRDAWQGLKGQIPTYMKTEYLKALMAAGFKHIDAVSFVSTKAVPQMADSEEALKDLDAPEDVEIIGIVVNEKGAVRAIETKVVTTLGFPYSVSPTFLQNNQHQTPEQSIDELEKIKQKADDAGLDTVVYISAPLFSSHFMPSTFPAEAAFIHGVAPVRSGASIDAPILSSWSTTSKCCLLVASIIA